jgi:hypothetical protein
MVPIKKTKTIKNVMTQSIMIDKSLDQKTQMQIQTMTQLLLMSHKSIAVEEDILGKMLSIGNCLRLSDMLLILLSLKASIQGSTEN